MFKKLNELISNFKKKEIPHNHKIIICGAEKNRFEIIKKKANELIKFYERLGL